MIQALVAVQSDAIALFAATLLLAVFFLVARVARARQPIALAFATMPLLATWAMLGLTA